MELAWRTLRDTALLQSAADAMANLGRTYLHQSTRDMANEVWRAQSTADVLDWVQKSSPDLMSGPFWLDVMLICSVLLITVSMTCCMARCFCWLCVDFPRAARELNDIRDGKNGYQKEAMPEQMDDGSRRGDGKRGKVVSASDDLALVSKMMRQHMNNRRMTQPASEGGASGGAAARQTGATPASSSAPSTSHGSTHDSATRAAASGTSSAQAAGSEFRPTRRSPPPATCTATIRGFPQVDILTASAAQNYLLLNCRAKRKTVVYTQRNISLLYQSGGPRAKEVELSATAVEKAVASAMRRESAVEVYAASFTDDDGALVIGERNTDTFFVFAMRRESSVRDSSSNTSGSPTEVESAVLASCVRQFKLPDRRLVSSLPTWRLLGSVGLLTFQQKDCAMELLLYSSASVDSGTTAVSSKHKFKVGNALAWAQRGHDIAAAGSFMREVRLATLQPRSGAHSVHHNHRTTASAAEAGAGGGGEVYELTMRHVFLNPRKLRTLALCLVSPGLPSFNTRSYLIAFSEDGHGQIYDLSTLGSLSNTGEVVCSFTDTDFAGYDAQQPLRMLHAVSGAAYKEKLTVALIRGADVTVLRQSSTEAHFELTRVKDLYNVQDGNVVREAALIDGGRALVTCGGLQSGPARVFDLSK